MSSSEGRGGAVCCGFGSVARPDSFAAAGFAGGVFTAPPRGGWRFFTTGTGASSPESDAEIPPSPAGSAARATCCSLSSFFSASRTALSCALVSFFRATRISPNAGGGSPFRYDFFCSSSAWRTSSSEANLLFTTIRP